VDVALAEAYAGLAERQDVNVPVLYSRLGAGRCSSDTLDRDLTDQEIAYGLTRVGNCCPGGAGAAAGVREAGRDTSRNADRRPAR
jgi:hypothetical protein